MPPLATLRSLVVVVGWVARSEPGLARLLLKMRARVDPPGGGGGGGEEASARRVHSSTPESPKQPTTQVPTQGGLGRPGEARGGQGRPGEARGGQGRPGDAACGPANTSSPVRGALAQLAWLDTRVAAAGGLDPVLGRPQ